MAALEAEMDRMAQTIKMVRVLKPIQRQTDACTEMLREHVTELVDIFSGSKQQAGGSTAAGTNSQEQQQDNG